MKRDLGEFAFGPLTARHLSIGVGKPRLETQVELIGAFDALRDFAAYHGRMGGIRTVCCAGVPVRYYWKKTSENQHVRATVEAAKAALQDSGAELNPVLEADLEAQIEDRIELAEQGRLQPIDHVRTVRRSPRIEMYEIRWTHIGVVRVDKVSGLKSSGEAHLRLYYVETGQTWVVGVHIHEKIVISDDEAATRTLQNVEIDEAVSFAELRAEDCWGVEELS